MAKHYFQLSKILKKLLYDRRMNPSELAREVDLPAPTIHRLVTGKSTRPYRSSLEPIADFFSLSVDQLIGDEPLPEPAINQKLPTTTLKVKQIPLLLSWENIEPFLLDKKSLTIDDQVFVDLASSDNAFALQMNDSSMEPYFHKGTILILDPEKPAKDRGYVLAKIDESNALIFRQILIDGEHQYLKPMNPDLNAFPMRILKKNDKILATLIEFRHRYNDV